MQEKNVENLIINDLKDTEYRKVFLSGALEDYIEDGDFDSFCRCLEIAIRAQDTVSNFAQKIGLSREHLYKIFKAEKEPKLTTVAKILKELGCKLNVA